MQVHPSPKSHTTERYWVNNTTRNTTRPRKTTSLLCLFSRKNEETQPSPKQNFTDITNLVSTVTNSPLSWTPSTADKLVNPNDRISLDWGIIHKRAKANVNNVFVTEFSFCWLDLAGCTKYTMVVAGRWISAFELICHEIVYTACMLVI